jgi:putative Holliday junction resolvase
VTAGRGRVLGLDLGDVRIGVAVSDPLGLTAQPEPHLRRIGPRKDLDQVRQLVERHGVERVIVGHPLLMSGESGERARQAEAFAERLREHLGGTPVELWDERLTTVQAERTLLTDNVRRDRRKQVVDGMAAALILQSWLDAESMTRDNPPL